MFWDEFQALPNFGRPVWIIPDALDRLINPTIFLWGGLAAAAVALAALIGCRLGRTGKPWTWWERLLLAVTLVCLGYSFDVWWAAGAVLAGLDPAHLDLLEVWASLPLFESSWDVVPYEQALDMAGPVREVLEHLAAHGELHLVPADLGRALADQVLHCRTASIFHSWPTGADVDAISRLLASVGAGER